MINDDEQVSEADGGRAIQYDYFKYLTSLCIISLGGVLALAEKVPGSGRGKEIVIAALVVTSLAATLAFCGVGELVRAATQRDQIRRKTLTWASMSPLVLSVGLGMFIYLFAINVLGHETSLSGQQLEAAK